MVQKALNVISFFVNFNMIYEYLILYPYSILRVQ